MHTKFLRLTLGGLSLFALTLAGCGGSNVTAPTPPPPTAQDPAPPVLQGVWGTVLQGTGEQVTLTLSARGYHVTRGPNNAAGAIAVHGDRIEFSQSNLCNGTGAYRWSLTGNSLLFTNLASDPCPGRSEVLQAQTYSKRG